MMAWATIAQAEAPVDVVQDFGVIEPKVRMMAPDFSLQGLDGKQYRLSVYRGKKAVLLHFWATWCVPCRRELPLLYALDKALADKGVVVLYVNVDRGHADAVQAFVRNIDADFNALLDADGTVRNAYAVRALPTTYVIGRDGKFSGLIIGERDWSKAVPALFEVVQGGIKNVTE